MNFLLIQLLLCMQMSSHPSDNYIKYYNLANQAQDKYDNEQLKEALSNIQSAFECVKHVHIQKLTLASEIATRLKNFKLAHRYLNKAIEQGLLISEIENDSTYIDFRKTSYFDKLKSNYGLLHDKYVSSLNKQYSDDIDSLYYVDQFVIRTTSTVAPKKIYKVVKDEHQTIINDSAVFSTLMGLIKKYGFPTEQLVRRESLSAAYIIILHSARVPKYQFYLTEMKSLLSEGKYHPFYYAWTYDLALRYNKKEPYYYCGIPYDKSAISESRLKEINQNRSEIGLELLRLEHRK